MASRVGCTKEWGAVVAGLTASMAKVRRHNDES